METAERGPGRFRVTHVPSGVYHEDVTDDMRRACELARIHLADGLHAAEPLQSAYDHSTKAGIVERLDEFKFERIPNE